MDALPDRIAPSHGGTGVPAVTLNHPDFGMPVHEAARAANVSSPSNAVMGATRIPKHVTVEIERRH